MSTLAQLIAPHLGSTDAEIVALLNAPSVSVVDSTRWTYAGLALRFGPQAIGQIDETLKQTPGYDWVRLLLAGTGIDFSDAVTQAALEGLRRAQAVAVAAVDRVIPRVVRRALAALCFLISRLSPAAL